jgi:hypothetical protein
MCFYKEKNSIYLQYEAKFEHNTYDEENSAHTLVVGSRLCFAAT